MSSSRRRNTNLPEQANTSNQNETTARNADNLKWTHVRRKRLLELYNEAIAMNSYQFKDPTPFGREQIVEKFNKEFNVNVNYKFFKDPLDGFKRKYKMWNELMGMTGISVDSATSTISASDEWWKEREAVCKTVRALKRRPPEFWDMMQDCFALYDVQSQRQYSVQQRREQMLNEGARSQDSQDYSDTDGVDMPQTHQTEEVYRVRVDDDTRPTTEFTNEQVHQSSEVGDASTAQQRGRGSRGRSSQRPVGTSRVSRGSGQRGTRKKQSFEKSLTDTMTGFRDFQRQTSKQFGQNVFDSEECEEIMVAINLFESLDIERNDDFHFACINMLNEEKIWRKYFIEKEDATLENKLKFLENLTGVSRDGAAVEKRLRSSNHFGSPRLGGLYSGSPSSGGQWGAAFQQFGTPPNAPHWGTPPNAPHWGTPPTAPQWGTPPNATQWISPTTGPQWGPPPNSQQWASASTVPQWGTPPNAQPWGSTSNAQPWGQLSNGPHWGPPPTAHQWGGTSNAPSWGTSSNSQQLGSTSNVPQWDTPSNAQPWGSSSNAPQWGSPEIGPECTPTRNVQRGFTVDTPLESTSNAQEGFAEEAGVPDSQNLTKGVSPEYELTNRSVAGKTGRTRRMGGLFNIWGSKRGPDLNESQQSYHEDEE